VNALDGKKRVIALCLALLDIVALNIPGSNATVELVKQIVEPLVTVGFLVFAIWGILHARRKGDLDRSRSESPMEKVRAATPPPDPTSSGEGKAE
jgi:hypothetical protein